MHAFSGQSKPINLELRDCYVASARRFLRLKREASDEWEQRLHQASARLAARSAAHYHRRHVDATTVVA